MDSCSAAATSSLWGLKQVASLLWGSVSLCAKPEGWSRLWTENGERQSKIREEGALGGGYWELLKQAELMVQVFVDTGARLVQNVLIGLQ